VEGYGRVVSRIAVTLGGSGEGDVYHYGWLGLFSRRCLYCEALRWLWSGCF